MCFGMSENTHPGTARATPRFRKNERRFSPDDFDLSEIIVSFPPPRRRGGARGGVGMMRRGLDVLRLELLGHLLVARVSILQHRVPVAVGNRDAVEILLPERPRGGRGVGRAVGLAVSAAPVRRLTPPVRAVRHVPPLVAVRLARQPLLRGIEVEPGAR